MSALDGGKYCDYIYQWNDNYDADEGIQWWNYMYKNNGDNSKQYDLRDWLDSFYRGYWRRVRP